MDGFDLLAILGVVMVVSAIGLYFSSRMPEKGLYSELENDPEKTSNPVRRESVHGKHFSVWDGFKLGFGFSIGFFIASFVLGTISFAIFGSLLAAVLSQLVW